VRNTVTSIIEISPMGVRRFPGGYDYYREKVSGECREPDAAPKSSDSGPDGSAAPVSAKDMRRARAQARAKHQPTIRSLKDKVSRAEARISELEAELEALSGVLFNPTPETDFSATNRRLKYVQDQLSAFSEEWERAATELDRLQRDQDEAQDALL